MFGRKKWGGGIYIIYVNLPVVRTADNSMKKKSTPVDFECLRFDSTYTQNFCHVLDRISTKQ